MQESVRANDIMPPPKTGMKTRSARAEVSCLDSFSKSAKVQQSVTIAANTVKATPKNKKNRSSPVHEGKQNAARDFQGQKPAEPSVSNSQRQQRSRGVAGRPDAMLRDQRGSDSENEDWQTDFDDYFDSESDGSEGEWKTPAPRSTRKTAAANQKGAAAAKIQKPPPIMTEVRLNRDNIKKMNSTVKPEEFTVQQRQKSSTIRAETIEGFHQIKEFLAKEKIGMYSYTPRDEATRSYVIKGLDPGHDVAELGTVLAGLLEEKIIFIKEVTGKYNSIYLFNVRKKVNFGTVKEKVKCIENIKVRTEVYKNRRIIGQCHRCQKWGHASGNCTLPVRCVKCDGDHITSECVKPKDSPATCANCGGPHTASSVTCPVYIKKLKDLNITTKQQVEPAQEPRQTPPWGGGRGGGRGHGRGRGRGRGGGPGRIGQRPNWSETYAATFPQLPPSRGGEQPTWQPPPPRAPAPAPWAKFTRRGGPETLASQPRHQSTSQPTSAWQPPPEKQPQEMQHPAANLGADPTDNSVSEEIAALRNLQKMKEARPKVDLTRILRVAAKMVLLLAQTTNPVEQLMVVNECANELVD